VIKLPPREPRVVPRGHDRRDAGDCIATLVELSCKGPLVQLAGAGGPPVLARSTVPRAQLDGKLGCELLVTVVGERDVVVIGVVQDFSAASENSPPQPVSITGSADVDGKRVVIRAAERIVFRCGQSSLVMRADGHIIVRGNHVETRARRLNRIRGGFVKVN
jgi:hypothetical protein